MAALFSRFGADLLDVSAEVGIVLQRRDVLQVFGVGIAGHTSGCENGKGIFVLGPTPGEGQEQEKEEQKRTGFHMKKLAPLRVILVTNPEIFKSPSGLVLAM